MAEYEKEKASFDSNRAQNLENANVHDSDASPARPLPADMPPAEPQMTKHGRLELVPQPSDDPRDPLNWSAKRKWTVFGIMCYGTFTTVSAAVANNLATPVQAADWEVTPEQATYTVSCTLAGIVIGPLLVVPLVRVFGVMSLCFWSCIMVAISSIWHVLRKFAARLSADSLVGQL